MGSCKATKSDLLTEKEQGSLTLTDKEECSVQQVTSVKEGEGGVGSKRGRPKRRKEETLKSSLAKILSLEISPSSVAEEVTKTPLGDKITYQEAILIAQILKATRGDNQAVCYIQKLYDSQDAEADVKSLEDFLV